MKIGVRRELTMNFEDHDPWNDPSQRHPRAAHVMSDPALWDCVNELAPFGSDEGADAYYEYFMWRSKNPLATLVDLLMSVLGGKLSEYNEELVQDAVVERHLSDDAGEAVLGLDYPDSFTLDATIIATVLGQLVREGRIDEGAKSYGLVAVARQSHPKHLAYYRAAEVIGERLAILQSVQEAIKAG